MTLKIRPVKEVEEIERVEALAALDKHTRGATNPMNLNQAAIDKGWVILATDVASAEDVGFLVIRHCVREPHTSLYYIGVHPSWQQQGIGEELVWWLMEDSPHRRIRLVCEVENEKANAFYKRMGFRHHGTSETKGGTVNNIWILEDTDA